MSLPALLAEHGLTAHRGTKSQGYLTVPGTPVQMPVTVIVGPKPGKNILLTGGVHGGEYPCIETAIRLAKELRPEDIEGTLVIIHPVNPPAFLAKLQYYGPYDGKNLNRVFPGKALGTVSERIAYAVHQLQKNADFFIDLHGGDIHEALVPFVIYSHLGGPEVTAESKAAAIAMGFPYIVGSVSETGSIGGAATAGVPGLLAELGQCGRWSEQEVSDYTHAVKRLLQHLEVLPGGAPAPRTVTDLEKMLVIQAQEEGCWYPSVALTDIVRAGEKVGEIRDFFGHTQREYFAEQTGVVLYVVTSLAITTGDPLLALGV